MKSIYILFILFFSFFKSVYAEELLLNNNDINFINSKSNNFIINLNLSDLNNSITNKEKESYNCLDFKRTYYKVYSKEYMDRYCFLKNSFIVSREKGYLDATKEFNNQIYINKVKNILDQDDYTTEGVNDILYQLNNINPIDEQDINNCKEINNPYSDQLPKCLSKIYQTASNSYIKYMNICDSLYSSKKESDICMVNLGNKSFNPFDRVETKCFVNNYYAYTNDKGKVLRRLDTGPYYQCLSYHENGVGFELWNSQIGYREGYTTGLYIMKTQAFNFLKNND